VFAWAPDLAYFEGMLLEPKAHRSGGMDRFIWIDSDRMSGAPCFTGARVPVQMLLDHLKQGETIDDFLEASPSVTRKQAELWHRANGANSGTNSGTNSGSKLGSKLGTVHSFTCSGGRTAAERQGCPLPSEGDPFVWGATFGPSAAHRVVWLRHHRRGVRKWSLRAGARERIHLRWCGPGLASTYRRHSADSTLLDRVTRPACFPKRARRPRTIPSGWRATSPWRERGSVPHRRGHSKNDFHPARRNSNGLAKHGRHCVGKGSGIERIAHACGPVPGRENRAAAARPPDAHDCSSGSKPQSKDGIDQRIHAVGPGRDDGPQVCQTPPGGHFLFA